jgi:hypothetical protein
VFGQFKHGFGNFVAHGARPDDFGHFRVRLCEVCLERTGRWENSITDTEKHFKVLKRNK